MQKGRWKRAVKPGRRACLNFKDCSSTAKTGWSVALTAWIDSQCSQKIIFVDCTELLLLNWSSSSKMDSVLPNKHLSDHSFNLTSTCPQMYWHFQQISSYNRKVNFFPCKQCFPIALTSDQNYRYCYRVNNKSSLVTVWMNTNRMSNHKFH